MTLALYRNDPYQSEAEGTVISHTTEGAVILNQTIFYPTGGGQPGDSGQITWADKSLDVATAIKTEDGHVALVPAEPRPLPPIGIVLQQRLDWQRRHRLMRMHTALHLLSVVIPMPVTGGAIGEERSRLDFDIPDMSEDRAELETKLNLMVDHDLPVTETWISDDALRANPELVKTMTVKPPMGAGRVRLIRIGQGGSEIDLQPCGGTHVARTGEIGRLRLGKVEKKGRQNRRVYLHLDG
ncbi:Ala-tRNA(Pro) hydrolase [Roseovarius azorensis]|uniref:Alanine--tRNA ligase n=1 Tax=Roseovarius azorensis TaxID=1287727 RepID=A0A1H7HWE8_9RHOB|nr:alanyl-tRNA editing protein [Roseovarius azorensis]SEK54606.1 Ala-tRNA(Pro) hydrolase [Roseovarius azorensis]